MNKKDRKQRKIKKRHEENKKKILNRRMKMREEAKVEKILNKIRNTNKLIIIIARICITINATEFV